MVRGVPEAQMGKPVTWWTKPHPDLPRPLVAAPAETRVELVGRLAVRVPMQREVLRDREYPAVEKLAPLLDLAGHGFRWFRIASDPTQTAG